MTIAITGGKYANNTISTVGTTTVTATTANFVSTDFTVQRIVGMWNSGGTTFLGMAFVRSFTSTSVLQLETAFYDPATGNTVAQTAGNVIIVSKNFTDSVTTNLAVSNAVVTLGDVIAYGSSSSAAGVCFYDQGVTLNFSFTTTANTTYQTQSILGGLVVLGKLENYSLNTVSQPVNLNYNSNLNTAGQGYLFGFVTNNANSNFIYYGGLISGSGISIPVYHGGYTGTAGYTMVLNTVTCPFDLISPGAGGTWGANAARMQLINCYTETSSTNAIGRRWGDGLQSGGSFKFPYNTSAPISALGGSGVPLSFGALPGNRATVLDFGANQITPGSSSTGGPVMTRGNTSTSNVWIITNLIATNYYAGTGQTSGGSVTSDTNSLNYIYFQDTLSGLASGSIGLVNTTGLSSSTYLNLGTPCSIESGFASITGINTFISGQTVQFTTTVGTSGGQVVSGTTYYVLSTGLTSSTFQVSASSGGTAITFNASTTTTLQTTAYITSFATGTWTPALLYGVWTGFSQSTATPSAWYYSISCYGKQIVTGTITPTTYQLIDATGPNVSFGATITQIADPGVGSITQATANAYTSISTLDQLYAAAINWQILSAANATYPSIGVYLMTYSGSQLNLGAISLVLATSGSAFSMNTSTNTLTINCTTLATGTIFTSFTTTGSVTLGTGTSITIPYISSAGQANVITLNNLLSGSIVITDLGTGTASTATSSSGTSITLYTTPKASSTFNYSITAYGYVPVFGSLTVGTGSVSSQSVTIVQSVDLGNTVIKSTASAYTSLTTLDQLYDYFSYYMNATTAGATQFFTYRKAGTWSGQALSKSGTTIAVISAVTSLTLSTAAIAGTTASSASTIVIDGVASSLAVGATTFSTLSAASVTTFTLTGVTVQFVYTISTGTSLAVNLTVPSGASVAILNGSGTVTSYTASSGASYSYYATPGQTGTWTYRVAKYGSISSGTTFTPSGQVTASISLNSDTGITQATVATVAAYTSLTTCDQLYDYSAYWQTTNNTGGIAVTNLVTKNSTQISLSSIALTFNNSTGTPLTAAVTSGAVSALTIQTGGTFATGSTFTSFGTTSTTTFTSTTVTCVYTNSSGTSTVLTLTNLPYTSSNGGTYLSILNNSSSQVQYIGPITSGSQVVYISPTSSVLTYSWKAACYGYISAATTFSTQGYVNNAASLSSDTGITNTSRSSVAAYTALTTCDQMYDYLAYLQTTNGTGGTLVANPATKNSTQVNFGSVTLTFNNTTTPVTATITSGAVTALTIGVGSSAVLATGSTFTSFGTSSTTTLNNSVSITCVYSNSSGTSTVLTVTGLQYSSSKGGTYLSLANGSGTQQQYVGPVTTGTQIIYVAPSSTATWSLICAAYGYLSYTGSVALQGYQTVIASLSTDTGITQGTVSTVSGYSSSLSSGFTTIDQMYDYLCYWQTTNGTGGITVARPSSKNGSQVSFGSDNVVFNETASSLYAYTAGSPITLTFKSTTIAAGTTYSNFATSGTVTTSNGATIGSVYTSNLGTSSSLQFTGLVAGSAIYIQNASAAMQLYVTGQSGTYTYGLAPGASSGTWTWSIKAIGYTSMAGSYVPSAGGSTVVTSTQSQEVQASGSVMYTGTTNSLCMISFTADSGYADILIGNGLVTAQNVYDISENALITQAGMQWIAQGGGELTIFYAPSGNYLFMTHNWRLKALNTSSPNATVEAFCLSTDGTPINNANGAVTILTTTQPSDVATAVWNSILSSYSTSGSAGAIVTQVLSNSNLVPALL